MPVVSRSPTVRAFIQARMTSDRFPGKVLAPFRGRPLLASVISRVAEAVPSDLITVATSAEESDDPLAHYAGHIGVSVYRGPLDDVFARFQQCLEMYPCHWFFRVNADSPLYSGPLLRGMMSYSDRSDIDLATNVQVRTFPDGHSVEMLYSATFAALDPSQLSDDEREHLTKVYYNHPQEFRILNVESSDPELAKVNLCVDTIEDLRRLEDMAADPASIPDARLNRPHVIS